MCSIDTAMYRARRRYSSMSSLGSTTAATPASSSPIRYEAQPRSSWVTWRKSTCASLSGSGRAARAGRQRVAALGLEEVDLVRVHPEPAAAARLDRAGRLEAQDRLVLLQRRQVAPSRVGGQLREVLALRALAAVGDVREEVRPEGLDQRHVGLEVEA